MLQRVQTFYLTLLFLLICWFLRATLWAKGALAHSGGGVLKKSYALIRSNGEYVFFPYAYAFILACLIAILAIYTIIRHDCRKLQLRLIKVMHLLLLIIVCSEGVVLYKIGKHDVLGDLATCKLGFILPIIALVLNLLAQHAIKKDEQLVHSDCLR